MCFQRGTTGVSQQHSCLVTFKFLRTCVLYLLSYSSTSPPTPPRHRGTGSFFTGSHKNTLPPSTSKYSYCYWCHYKGSWASFPGQPLITRKEGSVAISSVRSSNWHMLFLSKRNSSSMADAESPLMNFSCLLPNCLPLPHPALAGVVSWY